MNILEVPGDRLLVRQDKAKKLSKGGIVLPEQFQRAPNTGTILFVGDEVNVDRPDRPARRKWEAGTRVAFAQHAGSIVILEEFVCVIMDPDEVLAVIDHDPEAEPAPMAPDSVTTPTPATPAAPARKIATL